MCVCVCDAYGKGIPGDSLVKESNCSLRVGKIPWRREWLPTPLFLTGKFHEQRSLVGYSPWGCRVGHNFVTKPPPPYMFVYFIEI